jgi:hypothetical protein
MNKEAENFLLKDGLKSTTVLLQESLEAIGTAIGVELEYGDYGAVERLKNLKVRIENEITKHNSILKHI